MRKKRSGLWRRVLGLALSGAVLAVPQTTRTQTADAAAQNAQKARDVLNAMGYRLRPYEVNAGDTDRAIEECKQIIYAALLHRTNILHAMWKCKPILNAVKVDRTQAKPKVSIIGEFWAMTTEGDGNYGLQRFLESEGGECDIQLVTAWILYTLWEAEHDTLERSKLRGADVAKYGLGELSGWAVGQKMLGVKAGQHVVRGLFQTFAHAAGLYGYHLPDMNEIAALSHEYYNNDLRGGEGHMEVGKLIMNVTKSKAHMTLSVKPFGCMPSAGVSDGVQSAITEKFPGTIFCPVETSGDGRVNFYSRVQMYLFKAKKAAVAEYERALQEAGVTRDEVRAFLDANPKYASALHKAPHVYSGCAADVAAEVGPLIRMSRGERLRARLVGTARATAKAVRGSPHVVSELWKDTVDAAPSVAARVKEDILVFQETRKIAKAKASAAPAHEATAHAAE